MSDRAPQVAQPAVEHGPMNPRLTARRRTCVAGTVLVLAATLVVAPPASGVNAAATTAPVPVSGVNSLPAEGSEGHCGTGAAAQDWESDNDLAADRDAGSLVTAWIQDFNDAVVVGYSSDNGRTWKRSLPKTTACTWALNDDDPSYGEMDFTSFTSVIDPSLATGPSPESPSMAITYLSSIVSNGSLSATVVHRSLDGGRTWSNPKVLDTAAVGTCPDGVCAAVVDQTDLIADGAKPGHAYAAWFKFDAGLGGSDIFVASTNDGGDTWSGPKQVTATRPGVVAGFPQLVLDPNGELVIVYAEIELSSLAGAVLLDHATGPTTIMAARSTDGGDTWSEPTQVAKIDDPDHAIAHRVTTAPDGTIYVAWQQAEAGGTRGTQFSLMYSSLKYSASENSATTWSAPEPIGDPIDSPPRTANNRVLAAPAVAVADNGTLGVAFYDHRNDPDGAPATTDYWLRTLDAAGTYRGEHHLAGPFDRTTAPDFNGRRAGDLGYAGGHIGDYQGMVPLGGHFGLSFVLAQPLDGANFELSHEPENKNDLNTLNDDNVPTDVFFLRIKP